MSCASAPKVPCPPASTRCWASWTGDWRSCPPDRTSTDRSFTKLVLRDLELRNALLASPKDGLLILPGPGREGLHLVESYSYPDSMYTDWYSEPMNTGPDWTDTEEERAEKEEKLAELAQDTFFPRLEKVIGLTKAARGAALTWRMGTPG